MHALHRATVKQKLAQRIALCTRDDRNLPGLRIGIGGAVIGQLDNLPERLFRDRCGFEPADTSARFNALQQFHVNAPVRLVI